MSATFLFFFFFFTKWQRWNNYEKCFLFHLKTSFHCQDIQTLVFPSSPLFFPVSHWLRGWWKKMDDGWCINKSLITNFVWYLENEIRLNFELEFCQLIEYYVRDIFMENDAKNVHQKLVLDPFLVLVNNPKQ